MHRIAVPVLLLSFAAAAQVQSTRPPFIRATGQASVSVQPDTAKIDLGVITQAATAQAASSQNATEANAVIAALQGLLGANADIKTISYAVNPNYTYPTGSPPNLVSYTVTDVVEVTIGDLTIVGKVVDTAVTAGANSVQRLTFTLKDDSSVRQQALRLAAQQAMSDANAIASGLSVHTGAVLSAIEGSTATPIPVMGALAAAPSSTPIQPSNLVIQATVTLDLQIAQ